MNATFKLTLDEANRLIAKGVAEREGVFYGHDYKVEAIMDRSGDNGLFVVTFSNQESEVHH